MRKLTCWLCLVITLLFASMLLETSAAPGDTLIVQTYTWEEQNDPATAYDNPGRRWFDFPADDGTKYQKILMHHKLKCFSDGTAGNLGFPCGEWDYLSYNYMLDHTGMLDSNLVEHPQFLANNQQFDTIEFVSELYVNTQEFPLYSGAVVSSENTMEYSSILGIEESAYPFKTSSKTARSQYLWRATELVAMGMAAGEIGSIKLDVSQIGSSLDWLKLKIQNTSADSLTGIIGDGWTSVYAWGLFFDDAGMQEFQFVQPFNWDGTSNLAIEICNENLNTGGDNPVMAGDAGFDAAVHSSAADGYVDFEWFDEVKIPAEALSDVGEQISISFWLNGDEEAQPESSTIFEGVNSANQRVLNSHLPWSNGRVYWDAGQDGGYDRIDKLAVESNYEGQWSHWAFTKNTITGSMKIYLNGELWHSGANLDNPMDDIVKFSLGSAAGWSNFYNGSVDDFQIWSVELDEATIADWMYRDLDDTHPNWSDLNLYYQFNDENGLPVADMSGQGHDGVQHGNPSLIKYHADELFKNYTITNSRPNVVFVQGDFVIEEVSGVITIQIPVTPVSLSEWIVDGNQVVIDNMTYQFPVGYSYVFDEFGVAIDSTFIDGDIEYINTTLQFFEPPYEVVDRYELGRFITPYGIQLSLDDDGWTWVYDVTDWEPFLHDSVELQCGNWQELLDLKFLFIEGEPTRDVQRVEKLWNGNWGLNNWNTSIEETTLEFEEGEVMAKVTATTTGHGFGNGANCGEFCNNIHSLKVNGEAEWQWQIMQECADNPLFPQGGTWIYDRAGWCPGAPGTLYEFEVTPWIEDGEISLDYDIQEDPYGNYVFEAYMFTYGDFNYTNDAEISEIISPSSFKLNSRMNPICNKPEVQIRNNGSETLTSLLFTYGVAGTDAETFLWTGSLEPLESLVVELEYNNPVLWEGEEDEIETFEVSIAAPNGVTDENPSNNSSASQFVRPPMYTYGEGDDDDNRLILWHSTNDAYWETSYTIYDMDGNEVYGRDDFSEAGTTYRDTIQLSGGCYLFHLEDSGDDGLSFFANNDGNGSMRLKKVGSATLETFQPNFGKDIKHYFYWNTDIVSTEELPEKKAFAVVYPNPGTGEFFLKLNGFDQNVEVNVYDTNGRLVKTARFRTSGDYLLEPLDLQHVNDGLYYIKVSDGKNIYNETVVVAK
ncbi:MAG: hypothetical protein ACI84C_000062 [Flavobacteriales bacterium]|jgi:hypothetical protein